jgi:hypothetical protein
MMKNFTQWIQEKKKTKESMPTTNTSSPLRGANQDYSGVNTKNDNADYTISDEKHPMPDQPEWEKTTAAQRKAHAKHLVKVTSKGTHGAGPTPVAEVVAGTNPATRTTPVNMKTSGHSGGSNAPQNAHAMQHAADARRIQLDKLGQQQQELQKKKQEQDQRVREKQQQIDQKKSDMQKQKPTNEEVIAEGRPKKNATEDEPGSDHIMMQMRKVISTRGQHQVKHVSGEKSEVHPQTAHKILQHHDNLKTPAEKQAYAARIHKSKASMSDAMAGKPEQKQPKVSLAGKLSGTQK